MYSTVLCLWSVVYTAALAVVNNYENLVGLVETPSFKNHPTLETHLPVVSALGGDSRRPLTLRKTPGRCEQLIKPLPCSANFTKQPACCEKSTTTAPLLGTLYKTTC